MYDIYNNCQFLLVFLDYRVKGIEIALSYMSAYTK